MKAFLFFLFISCFLNAEILLPLNDSKAQTSSYLCKYDKTEDSSIKVSISKGKAWPGVSLNYPKGIDIYKFNYVLANISNLGTLDQTFYIAVIDSKKRKTISSKKIKAGESSTIELVLKRKDDQWKQVNLFGMRTLPWMERLEEPADLHKIKSISISVENSPIDTEYKINSLNISGQYSAMKFPKPFFPFIDQFGQYIHKNWPGKIGNVEHLKDQSNRENLSPLSNSQFGGIESELKFDIKGRFYTIKRNGKWLIIDPEGKPFYSMGVNSVNFTRGTPYDSRENWFNISGGSNFLTSSKKKPVHGFYKGKTVTAIDFLKWNLDRKYGPNYKEIISNRTLKRFKAWGINTIGAWSDRSLYGKKHAYTIILQPWSRGIDSSNGHYGKFPDVYDKDFSKNIEQSILSLPKNILNDPYCLGIFIHNELPWGDETNFAYWALNSYNYQPAKQAFVADLKEKYKTIRNLNSAWGSKLDSWKTLLDKKYSPDYFKTKGDLLAYCKKFSEKYFKTCKEAIQKHAPGRLYLGCRFAYNNQVASAAAVKYCDIVSVNLYYSPLEIGKYSLPGLKQNSAPLIVGEFHFGARDRGFAKGLRGADSQKERTMMMKEYIESCLRHPGFVGTHWFQMYDQPVTGRVQDGENYQVGLVDITDSPYSLLINTLKKTIINSPNLYLPK